MAAAYFAGGCFWCITPVFRDMDGVFDVVSGYSGGTEQNPVYEDVKHQRTGHRETICISFDPQRVSFDALLALFLQNVDPFDAGGQYIDRGHSYTLAVYYTDDEQRAAAEKQLQALALAAGRGPCVSIEPFSSFWRAEEYHQDYDLKNPEAFAQELIESGRKRVK